MKKKLCILLLAVLCLSLLTGCIFCKHEWEEANCTDPKTCVKCEETEGAPLGHTWQAATCSDPKTCEDCGETEGRRLDHDWDDATCTAPATCKDCGETDGDPLPHNWLDATCLAPMTCADCGLTEGELAEHQWEDYVCTVCGEEDEIPVPVGGLGCTIDTFIEYVELCLPSLEAEMEYCGYDDDGWPYYLVESLSNAGAPVAMYLEPDVDGETMTTIILIADGTDTDTAYNLGAMAGLSWGILHPDTDEDIFDRLFEQEPTAQGDATVYSICEEGMWLKMLIYPDYLGIAITPA